LANELPQYASGLQRIAMVGILTLALFEHAQLAAQTAAL
jgi:hypothetical protein